MNKSVRLFFIAVFILYGQSANSQEVIKPLSELVQGTAGWERVTFIASHARNKVQILEKDSARSSNALMESQLSTNTLLGSIIYSCGGILIDEGWIRILGSGNSQLTRSVPEWNKGKLAATRNDESFYLLVADDVLGGLFAIKAGSAEELETIGQVFYYGPNSLTWQPTGLSYSSFISYCFSGNIKDFYSDFRWKGWQEDVRTIDCNTVISCYPMLWTREGLQLKANRKLLAIQTQWNMYQGKSKTGNKQKSVAQRQPARKQTTTAETMWSQNSISR
ncbi:MAG: DUF2625 family protein [Bacteroidota bacterium]